MFPLLLAFALFLFFTLVGKALLEVVRFPFPIFRSWLVAPAVGLSVVVLLTLNLNQLGVPVKNFAWWMTAALALGVALVFFKRRPIFPVMQLTISLGIALFATVYSGWPALKYSFGWEGFANHDMANYCFSATRFLNSGLYRIPTLEELSGTDYTQHMWFLYGPGMFRCGSDLILAWVSALSKLHPWEIAMPAIISLALCQIWTAGALALVLIKDRRQAHFTMSLLSLSPFFHHGTLIQVIPQVGGLTLLLALGTFCMGSFHERNSKFSLALRRSFVLALITSSLSIYYPEVLPFAVLSIGLFHAYSVFRNKESVTPLLKTLFFTAILWILIGRQNVVTALGTVRFAFGHSFERIAGLTSFEAARLPSATAVLFGFQSFYSWPAEPYQSILVAISWLLFLFVLSYSLLACLQAKPYAFLFLTMLAVGLKLFADASSFGLFKLGMYVQPLLMAGLAQYLAATKIQRAVVCCVIYCMVTLPTLVDYLSRSVDTSHKAVGALSMSKPISDLLVPSIPAHSIIAASTPYIVNDVILASALVGVPLKFLSREVAGYYAFEQGPISRHLRKIPARLRPLNSQFEQALRLSARLKETVGEEKTLFGASFKYPFFSVRDKMALVALKEEKYHPFNNLRDSHETNESNYFQFTEPWKLRNYLLFKATSRGGNYYDFGYETVYWQMERDPMIPNRKMYAVGRFLLFQILDSDPNVRMRVCLTKTICGPNRTTLPTGVVVMGASDVPLPLLGNGAANVFTGPIQPKKLDGIYYLAIDFSEIGKRFPVKRAGLMRLFNADVPVDIRQIVAFARDISIVNEKEYQRLDRPLSIDFSNPSFATDASIEFSGIYEDGWASAHSFFTMGKSSKGQCLKLEGILPGIKTFYSQGSAVELSVNGREIMSRKLNPGAFELTCAMHEDSEITKVQLKFKSTENLPGGDDRPVSVKLIKCSIGHAQLLRD